MKLTKLTTSLVALSALVTTLVIGANSYAQSTPGRAEVRAVKGTAYVSPSTGAPMEPLKPNMVLEQSATIKTGPASTVDLFLGRSAGVVRVTENSTLALDKLTFTETGADMVVEVQLNLTEGTILGNVSKLATASKYEIKVPNGVAGIRGTQYRISANGYIVLLQGTMIFVYVPPGGQPVPYTLQAPPPVYFSPIEGVKPAPEDLIQEVRGQLGPPPAVVPPPNSQGRPMDVLNNDPAKEHRKNPPGTGPDNRPISPNRP